MESDELTAINRKPTKLTQDNSAKFSKPCNPKEALQIRSIFLLGEAHPTEWRHSIDEPRNDHWARTRKWTWTLHATWTNMTGTCSAPRLYTQRSYQATSISKCSSGGTSLPQTLNHKPSNSTSRAMREACLIAANLGDVAKKRVVTELGWKQRMHFFLGTIKDRCMQGNPHRLEKVLDQHDLGTLFREIWPHKMPILSWKKSKNLKIYERDRRLGAWQFHTFSIDLFFFRRTSRL